jgi:protein-S-isoprenylcysteine O-methyltransferase Ste14
MYEKHQPNKKAKYYFLLLIGITSLLGIISFLYPYLLYKVNSKRIYTPIINKYGFIAMWFIWTAYFANLIFLLKHKTKSKWKTRGIYLAFIVSLFTEMFGWGYIVYLLSPLIKYPVLTTSSRTHSWLLPKVLGTYLMVIGAILIIAGWRRLYPADDLVTSGIYRHMRHPQYLGFIMVATGLLGLWPTMLTILLYPPLVLIYWRQANAEDKELFKKHGAKFIRYKEETYGFLPKLRVV